MFSSETICLFLILFAFLLLVSPKVSTFVDWFMQQVMKVLFWAFVCVTYLVTIYITHYITKQQSDATGQCTPLAPAPCVCEPCVVDTCVFETCEPCEPCTFPMGSNWTFGNHSETMAPFRPPIYSTPAAIPGLVDAVILGFGGCIIILAYLSLAYVRHSKNKSNRLMHCVEEEKMKLVETEKELAEAKRMLAEAERMLADAESVSVNRRSIIDLQRTEIESLENANEELTQKIRESAVAPAVTAPQQECTIYVQPQQNVNEPLSSIPEGQPEDYSDTQSETGMSICQSAVSAAPAKQSGLIEVKREIFMRLLCVALAMSKKPNLQTVRFESMVKGLTDEKEITPKKRVMKGEQVQEMRLSTLSYMVYPDLKNVSGNKSLYEPCAIIELLCQCLSTGSEADFRDEILQTYSEFFKRFGTDATKTWTKEEFFQLLMQQ